ncbi:LEA type 2 family protein [Thermococcus thermotolerans]|uniref:LEA type 2 family protein n=1 Tax=Thermococcus thermotolerans TaxID=2969672 RepID=UPI002158098C|nr:LEA type 2 family protein [Thermococcus thermotolerans]
MNWKLLILGAALIIISWIGYVAYAAMTANPTVHASWGYVDEKTTEIWVDAELSKPLLVPVEVENLSLNFMGIPVARVARFDYGATRSNINMAIVIDNENLVRSLVAYLDNGQTGEVEFRLKGSLLKVIPINADIRQVISEDILAYLNFTAESKELAGGLVKSPALVETAFDWAGEQNGKAVLIAHMKFYNPNKYPVPITKLSFDAYANGIKIGYGETEETAVIPPGGYSTVDVRMYVDESRLTKVWEIHVKNGEMSKVRADIFMDISVLNQRYSIRLASYEQTVKTDIMGGLNSMLENLLSG